MARVIEQPVNENRDMSRAAFLSAAGYEGLPLMPLTADASTRRYYRLADKSGSVLLMDAPVAAETAACPPDADEATRRQLGYNALARLAGPRLEAFVGIAEYLATGGVKAPRVMAYDPVNGFAIIEDFGDALLARAVQSPADERSLYPHAMQILRDIRRMPTYDADAALWPVQSYDAVALKTEADLLPEWYAPAYGPGPLAGAALEAWDEAWAKIFTQLSPPNTFVLRDFHAENLLVLPDGKDLAVIDFQDGLWGHAPYDVVSLLEDARRDVDLGLVRELIEEDRTTVADPSVYDTDYAILAAQRNAKILGIFARLVHRDGKAKYETFLPRVRGHFARDLQREPVAPLRQWVETYLPDLLREGAR